jgi:hypothetical protein
MQDEGQSHERHSIRVIPGKTTSVVTSYTLELLMQLIELHLARHYNFPLSSYSDCTSASTQINTTIRLCSNNAGLLMLAAHHIYWPMLQIYENTLITGSASRAEKKKTPLKQQEAIAIEDAVAN